MHFEGLCGGIKQVVFVFGRLLCLHLAWLGFDDWKINKSTSNRLCFFNLLQRTIFQNCLISNFMIIFNARTCQIDAYGINKKLIIKFCSIKFCLFDK